MAGQVVTVACGNEYDAANLRGDHGGCWETSLMMALEGDLVNLRLIEENSQYGGVGAEADATEASREQGEAWVRACVAAITRETRSLMEAYPNLPE